MFDFGSTSTKFRSESFGSRRGGMIVVRMVFRKVSASSLTGMSVSRATSATSGQDPPWLRAYLSRLDSKSVVVTTTLPR